MNYFKYYTDNHIAHIVLNRPDAMNAFSSSMMEEFLKIFREINGNSSIYCALLYSQLEKAFCAGGDVKEEHELDENSAKAFAQKGKACVEALENCPVPIIAAIHGYTLGAGVELILGCDIIIAAEDLRMGIPTINLGGIPGLGSTQRLPQLLGKSNAMDILLTGRTLTAEEALRLNLVQYIAPKDKLIPFALDLCLKLATKAPKAVQAMKKAIKASANNSLDVGLLYETQLFVETCLTEDHKEGTLAFLEKRPNKEFQNK